MTPSSRSRLDSILNSSKTLIALSLRQAPSPPHTPSMSVCLPPIASSCTWAHQPACNRDKSQFEVGGDAPPILQIMHIDQKGKFGSQSSDHMDRWKAYLYIKIIYIYISLLFIYIYFWLDIYIYIYLKYVYSIYIYLKYYIYIDVFAQKSKTSDWCQVMTLHVWSLCWTKRCPAPRRFKNQHLISGIKSLTLTIQKFLLRLPRELLWQPEPTMNQCNSV